MPGTFAFHPVSDKLGEDIIETMSNIKKIKIILVLTIFCSAFFVNNIAAQNINYKIPNPSRFESLEEVINVAASLIRPAFLIAFGAMILLGAFNILTSQGSDDKIANGKKTLTAAIIGFIIAVVAPTIVNLITNLVGVDGIA
jgi:hypothetical protein